MQKKLLTYAILPVLGLVFVGANIASAHGFGKFSNRTPEENTERQQTMFEHKAALLGISVEAFKESWAEGKSLMEIAEESGITEEVLREQMKEARKEKMSAHIQTLFDQGVITQEQADEKLSFMESKAGKGKGGRGFHRGLRI